MSPEQKAAVIRALREATLHGYPIFAGYFTRAKKGKLPESSFSEVAKRLEDLGFLCELGGK